MPFRIIAGAIGAFFLLQGLNWLGNPAGAATALGMPLLEGVGRSTQVGDISAFFLCLGGFALYGAYRSNAFWLRAAACLIGLPAVTRTLVWAFHDAPFPIAFIGVEAIASVVLFFAASRISAPSTLDRDR